MATNESNPSVIRQYDAVLTHLRAAQAVAHLLSNDGALEEVIANAANHLWQLGHDAETELDALLEAYRTEKEPKPEEPEEWTPAKADAEEKRLGAMILRLPYDSTRRLMHFVLNAGTAKRRAGEANVMSEADMAELLRRDHSLDTIDSFSFLKSKGDVTLTERAPTPPKLADLEQQIAADVGDALRTIDSFDIHEQDGAADKLGEIAAKAKELSASLNELCNSEHVSESAAT